MLSFEVDRLGECKIKSPLKLDTIEGDKIPNFIPEEARIIKEVILHKLRAQIERDNILSFEQAGPREMIYFEPQKTKIGIVTCGGLCPGINTVIRAIVMTAWYHYNIREIYGFRYGYKGLVKENNLPPLSLNPTIVANIMEQGGSILGSSRGNQSIEKMVDYLEELNIDILFCIGGDGTLRGAQRIYEEVKKRNLKIAIVGVPKTIDNDIMYIEKSFGFETAFSVAVEAIKAAHTEAEGAENGVGIVKLMGRHSGYIACCATLALTHVNYILIPEINFSLYGEKGFLAHLKERLKKRKHAVIVVAEGTGQELIRKELKIEKLEYDASGNVKLYDIGKFLKQKIEEYLKSQNMTFSIKYIDPSYIIRSLPPVPSDNIFCLQLGQMAVHGGMAGKTGMVVGYWNGKFTYLPISAAISARKVVSPESNLWLSVLEATGQPDFV